MRETFRARRARLVTFAGVAASAIVIAIVVATAAGASPGGSAKPTARAAATDLVAQAKANVLAAAGWPKKWRGPTTPTKPQTVKDVVLISCSQATACARETAGSVAGANVMGWHTTVVDGKGDPNVMSAAIRNAVVNGASGIILESTGVSALVSALQFAKSHNVPVVNNGAITAQQAGVDTSLVAGDNPDPNVQRGKISADWMIWNSNGKAGVVVFRTTDAGLQTRDAATVARLKQCKGCKILFQDVVGFDVTTTPKMTQEMNSILDRFGNKVKYIRDPYSAADAFAVPALQARGRSDVQVLSDAPSQLQMQQCYQGKNIGAVYGDDLNWVGWEGVDMLNRALEHPGVKPPAENTQYVILLSPAKAYARPGTPRSATCPKNLDFSSGNPIDFKAKFKQLWGK
jgi:ABC-type sugar transport system substrate-binding protein